MLEYVGSIDGLLSWYCKSLKQSAGPCCDFLQKARKHSLDAYCGFIKPLGCGLTHSWPLRTSHLRKIWPKTDHEFKLNQIPPQEVLWGDGALKVAFSVQRSFSLMLFRISQSLTKRARCRKPRSGPTKIGCNLDPQPPSASRIKLFRAASDLISLDWPWKSSYDSSLGLSRHWGLVVE